MVHISQVFFTGVRMVDIGMVYIRITYVDKYPIYTRVKKIAISPVSTSVKKGKHIGFISDRVCMYLL